MTRLSIGLGMACLCVATLLSQQTRLTDEQLRSAAIEVPRLVEQLELSPGTTVADVGAGFGAWTLELARWTGPSGRVYATDVGAPQLAALRDVVARERMSNVTVLEGAPDATNLPPACCDAILIRDAFHHLTEPAAIIRSIAAALRPGGRLAVIDFPPRPGSTVPDGVPADRGGHGVPVAIVEREVGAVLAHVRTVEGWSPDSQPDGLFLVIFRKGDGR